MPSDIVFRTVREQIADYIRRDLLAGELKEGDQLREVELAERFGVSRGPVRDALLQLTQEGLGYTYTVGRGACAITWAGAG